MPSVEAEVLAANQAFYDAFARRDFVAMEALWASGAPVACIHPGWAALRGRAEVIASWRGILDNPATPAITCQDASCHVLGEVAFVICMETLGNAQLVATNLFAREDGAWKIVHHQAGPTSARAERAAARPKPSGMLN